MSKLTFKMTHGAIGEAMCCYTDGSYKDADIALTEYENSIRADERAKTIEEYKNKAWEDIEARYKSDIKIPGYLSAEKLLKDVHNSLYYFAKQMKGDEGNV